MPVDPTSPAVSLPPSPWIRRFAPLLAPGAQVLDLACGSGRHARFLAGLGHHVRAVDRDDAALAALAGVAGVCTLAADLETARWPFGAERFGGIVVAHYLHRPLFGALLGALADDGVLLYETFAAGNEAHGRPSNPAFLLQPGELLALCSGRLEVVAFEQGRVEVGGRVCVLQRLAAVGLARRWPPVLPEA